MHQPLPRPLAAGGLAAMLAAVLAAALAGCGSSPEVPVGERLTRTQPPLLSASRTGPAAAIAIERAMDISDRLKLGQVLELSSSSAPVSWRNPVTGNEFTLNPLRGHAGNYGPCREFSVDATVAGVTERLRGTACQGPDPRWRVLH